MLTFIFWSYLNFYEKLIIKIRAAVFKNKKPISKKTKSKDLYTFNNSPEIKNELRYFLRTLFKIITNRQC